MIVRIPVLKTACAPVPFVSVYAADGQMICTVGVTPVPAGTTVLSASAVADAAEMQAVASSVNCPNNFDSVVDDVPMTVLFAPMPIADDPMTIELLSLLFRPRDPAPK